MRMSILMPITIFMTRFYHSIRYSTGSKSLSFHFSFILAILIAAFSIAACEEDPTVIGKELLPGSDFLTIESTDTITPVSYTMYDDSIRSDNSATSHLGTTWDPYFGTTTASFVSELRLKEDWDGEAWIADSVKLHLTFSSVSGGTGGTHTLNIREIATQLSPTEKYYSTTTVAYEDLSIDIPLPTLKEDTVNTIVLKITEPQFAQRLLRDTSMLFHSNKVPDFRSYFKGLRFGLTSTGSPLMATLSLSHGGNTGVQVGNRSYKNFFVIYLHNSAGTTRAYYLILDAVNRNASFNQYNHDFSTAEAGKRIQHYNDPAYRDSTTYLQSLNGVYTRIVLPGLAALKSSGQFGKVAINKARLTVPFFTDDVLYTEKSAPEFLYIRYRTVAGPKPIVPDFNVDEHHYYYDGLVDTTNHVYNFNISSFVQFYLEDTTGDILPELELVQASGTKNLILKGNSSHTPVKFDFAYTRY